MQFHLMHISLLLRPQGELFGRVAISRDTWLRELFAEPIRFTHSGNTFHYVPDPDYLLPLAPVAIELSDGPLVGRIEREITGTENEPPEKGGREIQRQQWQASFVFIDPTEHDDGQRVAIQQRDEIGQPLALMTALATHINQRADPRPPYVMTIAPISDAKSFWDFVEQNQGVGITNVEFDLVTPNMFDGPEKIAEEMKALRDEENAKKLKIGLESEDGLHLKTTRIASLVEYTAEKGGGTIKARARNKKTYDSKNKIRKVPVPEPVASEEKTRVAEILSGVRSLIFGGR